MLITAGKFLIQIFGILMIVFDKCLAISRREWATPIFAGLLIICHWVPMAVGYELRTLLFHTPREPTRAMIDDIFTAI